MKINGVEVSVVILSIPRRRVAITVPSTDDNIISKVTRKLVSLGIRNNISQFKEWVYGQDFYTPNLGMTFVVRYKQYRKIKKSCKG